VSVFDETGQVLNRTILIQSKFRIPKGRHLRCRIPEVFDDMLFRISRDCVVRKSPITKENFWKDRKEVRQEIDRRNRLSPFDLRMGTLTHIGGGRRTTSQRQCDNPSQTP